MFSTQVSDTEQVVLWYFRNLTGIPCGERQSVKEFIQFESPWQDAIFKEVYVTSTEKVLCFLDE